MNSIEPGEEYLKKDEVLHYSHVVNWSTSRNKMIDVIESLTTYGQEKGDKDEAEEK